MANDKIRLTLPPEAERYVRRDAPVGVRRMAAGGALPLGPVDLATVLFALVHDPDDEVKSRAQTSLEQLPDNVLETVLSGEAHPAVLSFLAHLHKDHADRMERLALNKAADDRIFVFLASLPHRRVVDIVANNQERMLRCSEIVDALGENPLTGRATIDRILSFMGIDKPAPRSTRERMATAPRSRTRSPTRPRSRPCAPSWATTPTASSPPSSTTVSSSTWRRRTTCSPWCRR